MNIDVTDAFAMKAAAASVARMKCNEIRGTEPPSISLCAIETTKSTLYAVF